MRDTKKRLHWCVNGQSKKIQQKTKLLEEKSDIDSKKAELLNLLHHGGMNMSTTISNVTAAYASGTSYTSSTKVKEDNTEVSVETSYKEDVAAVYEKTDATKTTGNYKVDNQALIQKLQSDAEQRTAQMRSLVQQMMQQQGIAIGKADDMWSFLASGDFTVSAEVKAQAQADIAEDGYWGVNQTSDRILEFAKALSGGDASKADELLKAVEKGFKLATKSWGKELPDISNRTMSAVREKFAQWKKESGQTGETADTDNKTQA